MPLRAGVMKESHTPWVDNLVVVREKEYSLRVCLDMRRPISAVTCKPYPIHTRYRVSTWYRRKEEEIGEYQFHTTVDLAGGYLQPPLDEESSYKCGVVTVNKVYQMTHLPFGLKAAGSYFARNMAEVLGIKNILSRLRQFRLEASPKKCVYARNQITFLGHVIYENSYSPVKQIREQFASSLRPVTSKR
ncbi:unnamed protein product [Haemonchus placei]|uniref:Reverse transcriptase domain-containing protein n=1 Tax=Haemonchus placei TaxID=6290 RepID=A0A0N4WS84_HAEPC|nr:unnamed protein product [Haemonchus placei]